MSSAASTNRAGPMRPGAPSTGAIGPASFVQLVKARAGIFNRTTGSLKASGTLDDLAGVAASVISFDPQVIWDPTTNRFYYTMDSMFAATDQRLSWGFSKTSDPSNVTTDWCHYTLSYGIKFPDYPKLGDSQFFLIIGANVYSQKALSRIRPHRDQQTRSRNGLPGG